MLKDAFMKKFIIFVFIFSLFFSGCVTSLSDNQKNKKVKLDKDALYIKNNYLLLGKIDINSSVNEEKVVLNYLKNLIYTIYKKKFYIKQEAPNSNGIIIFILTLKDSFWEDKKKSLINKKCRIYFEDLKKLKNYINNPTKGDGYFYGRIIRVINEICHTIRMGGGNCKIIHNINELYELYKNRYEQCINKYKNKYKNDKFLRQTKILIKLTHMKSKKSNVLINVAKKSSVNNKLITEEYIVLKANNKLYILSLNKKRKFSKIFNRKLEFLSSKDLLKIKDTF